VIPPQGTPPALAQTRSEGEGEGEGEAEPEPPPREEQEEAPRDCDDESCAEAPKPSPYQPLLAQAAPGLPAGFRTTLPPGHYSLVTEHSRGDVAITYRSSSERSR